METVVHHLLIWCKRRSEPVFSFVRFSFAHVGSF